MTPALVAIFRCIHDTLVRHDLSLLRSVDTVTVKDGEVWAWCTPLKGGWVLTPACGSNGS